MNYFSLIDNTLENINLYRCSEEELTFQLPEDKDKTKKEYLNGPMLVEIFKEIYKEDYKYKYDGLEIKMHYEKYKKNRNQRIQSSLFLVSGKKEKVEKIKNENNSDIFKKNTAQKIKNIFNLFQFAFKKEEKKQILEKNLVFKIRQEIQNHGDFIVSSKCKNEIERLILCDFIAFFKLKSKNNNLFIALDINEKDKYLIYGNEKAVCDLIEALDACKKIPSLKEIAARFIAKKIPENRPELAVLPIELKELIEINR